VIPARIVTFINDEADMGVLGTRTAENVPQSHRTFGFIAAADGKSLRLFVPHFSLGGLAEAIADNGRGAINLGHSVSHETYQLKGTASALEDATESDRAHFAVYLERLVAAAVAKGMPEPLIRSLVQPPKKVVTLTVEDIFLQTPGPGAGSRLSEVEAK
jgi:hypothetical protein